MPSPRRNRRSRRSRGEDKIESAPVPAYITRQIPEYEILGEEGLSLIEANAEELLEEIYITYCRLVRRWVGYEL